MTAPANQPSEIKTSSQIELVSELVDVILDQVERNTRLRAALDEKCRLLIEVENDRDYWRREAEVNHDHACEVAERSVCPACFGLMFEE